MDSNFLQQLFNRISLSENPSEWLRSDDSAAATRRRLNFLAKTYGNAHFADHVSKAKAVHVATKNEALAKALINKADLLLAQNERHEEAAKLITQSLMFANENSLKKRIYSTRATLLIEQRRFELALNDLEKAAEFDETKGDLALLRSKADCLMEIGFYREAGEVWQILMEKVGQGGGRARGQREQIARQIKICKANQTKESNNNDNDNNIDNKESNNNNKMESNNKESTNDNEKSNNNAMKDDLNSLASPHPYLPNLSSSLEICFEPHRGRYVKAKNRIDRGAIIAIDEAFVHSLDVDQGRSKCWHCIKPVGQPLACDKCSAVVFCDNKCKKEAESYHMFECGITTLLQTSSLGAWILAYRAIISRPKSYFLEHKNILLASNSRYGTKPLETDVYGGLIAFHNLVSHDETSQKEAAELMMQCLTALFLLYCLQHKQYLNPGDWSQGLNEEQLFFAVLLHHYMRVAFYNTHELTFADIRDNFINIERIGRGTNPSLALFNHGCDPNYKRICLGKTTIGVAMRNIEEGEEIVDCYTECFHAKSKEERGLALQKYRFQCNCNACSQNWPVFSQLQRQVESKNERKKVETMERRIQRCKNQSNLSKDQVEKIVKMQIELCDFVEKSVKRPHQKLVLAEHELFQLLVKFHAS